MDARESLELEIDGETARILSRIAEATDSDLQGLLKLAGISHEEFIRFVESTGKEAYVNLASLRPTLRLEPHQVIIRPLITEKSIHRASRNNLYAFEVASCTTKSDIRKAVEQLFNVRVTKVNVQNRRGKRRRTRNNSGATRGFKKAIVKLAPDFHIALF